MTSKLLLASISLGLSLLSTPSFAWNNILHDLAKEAAKDDQNGFIDRSVVDKALAKAGQKNLSPLLLDDLSFESARIQTLDSEEVRELFERIRTGDNTRGPRELRLRDLIEIFSRVNTSSFSRDTSTYQRASKDWLPNVDSQDATHFSPKGKLATNLFSLLELALFYREASQHTPYPKSRKDKKSEPIASFVHLVLPEIAQRLGEEIFSDLEDDSLPTIAFATREEAHSRKKREIEVEVVSELDPEQFDRFVERAVGSQLLLDSIQSLLISVEEAVSGVNRDPVLKSLGTQLRKTREIYLSHLEKRFPLIMEDAEKRHHRLATTYYSKPAVLSAKDYVFSFGFGSIVVGGLTALMTFDSNFGGLGWLAVLGSAVIGGLAGSLALFFLGDSYTTFEPLATSKPLVAHEEATTRNRLFTAFLERTLLDGPKAPSYCDTQSFHLSSEPSE